MLRKIFSFLHINPAFEPDLTPKNVTGITKSESLQKGIIGQSKLKRFLIKYLVDFWMPVTRRKKIKAKLFEMNTGKTAVAAVEERDTTDTTDIKQYLETCFADDTKQLDSLMQTTFYEKWFANSDNKPKQPATHA